MFKFAVAIELGVVNDQMRRWYVTALITYRVAALRRSSICMMNASFMALGIHQHTRLFNVEVAARHRATHHHAAAIQRAVRP